MNTLIAQNYNLHFLDSKNTVSNMDAVIRYVNKEKDNITDDNRKILFFDSMKKLQNINMPIDREKIVIQFSNDHLLENLVKRGLIDKEDIEDNKHLYNEEEQKEINYNIEKALQLLNLLLPDLYKQISLLTGTYVCFKKEGFGGGSVSSMVGLTWLSPQKRWSVIDYAEALYHEYIHNSLFLDDMVNSVFPDPKACATEEALVTSTILKRKRPLDRAYHSACVAIALMHYYYMLRDFKKVDSFFVPLKQTILELNQRTEFLGERGLETLKGLNEFVEKQNYELITEKIKV